MASLSCIAAFLISLFSFASAQIGTNPNCGQTGRPLIARPFRRTTLASSRYTRNVFGRLNCRWIISPANAGRSVAFQLNEYNVNSCCDYIEVFSGSRSLDRVTGFSREARLFVSQPNQQLTVVYSAISNAPRTGFNGQFVEINNCGRELFATRAIQQFSTPGFPSPYPPNLDCYWNIRGTNSRSKVQITFESGSTQSCCHYIDIATPTRRLGRIRGRLTRQRYNGVEGLTVHFHSTNSRSLQGFLASYSEYECGGSYYLFNQNFSFSSPNYPQSIGHNADCVYEFQTEPGYLVGISINAQTRGSGDYVQLTEGGNDFRRLSGRTNEIVISRDNSLRLTYKTDDSGNSNGFTAIATQVSRICNSTYNAGPSFEQVNSPVFPNIYPNIIDCQYRVNSLAGFQILLDILAFQTQSNGDFIEIFDGEESMGRLATSVTDKLSIVSTSSSIRIVYRSEGYGSQRSFQFQFKEVLNCGTSLTAEKIFLSLSSPGYPQGYSNDLDCMWEIENTEGEQLALQLLGLTETQNDYVQVLNGLVPEARLSGRISPRETYYSSGSIFRLYFHSDSFSVENGFAASFRQFCTRTISVERRVNTLISPNYPNSSPNNYECTYNLRSRRNRKIQLNVNLFNTERCCDSLRIHDRDISFTLRGRIDGRRRYISRGQNLRLVYTTNESRRSGGFRITYESVSSITNSTVTNFRETRTGSEFRFSRLQ